MTQKCTNCKGEVRDSIEFKYVVVCKNCGKEMGKKVKK